MCTRLKVTFIRDLVCLTVLSQEADTALPLWSSAPAWKVVDMEGLLLKQLNPFPSCLAFNSFNQALKIC